MNNITCNDKFKYYLQPAEITEYTRRYVAKNGRLDIRCFDKWLNQHFMNLHQNTFVQAVAIVSSNDKEYTEAEYIKLLEDLEWQNIEPNYEFLGIENKIRLKSFARNLDIYCHRNRAKHS